MTKYENLIDIYESWDLDSLIDERYVPSKEKVYSVAAIHEDIEELLRLDPRYAKFFDDEE